MTFVMTNQTMRQRIISYLSQHKGVCAHEISMALRVTTADARHHLAYLVRTNQIQVVGTRKENKKGRPVQVYDLSEFSLGDNLPALTGFLLDMLITDTGAIGIEQIMQKLASKMLPDFFVQEEKNLTKKLAALILVLNKRGYQAKWEAHITAPRIIFDHCPYKQIIQKHPEICMLDRYILKQSLKSEILQTACLEKNLMGTESCLFEILPG